MQVFQDQPDQRVVPFHVTSRNAKPETQGLKMTYLEIIVVR